MTKLKALSEVLFVLLCSAFLLPFNGVRADAGDEALMTEGAKVFQTIQAKCQSKRASDLKNESILIFLMFVFLAVAVSKALSTAASCAEPILSKAGNLLPVFFYF